MAAAWRELDPRILVEAVLGIMDDPASLLGARLAGFTAPVTRSELSLAVIAQAVAGVDLDFLLPISKPEKAEEEKPTLTDRAKAIQALNDSIIIPE